ncbi:GntR family transcriptional regulator [Paracoccus homiensis]|uniref:DNA-binding transcriptional regulator, GntR family n=1 Tax=Paracoccus homiensis TaxID=364199 RepID=A0A1I0HVN7_9RHOB|nr:GntR family transcriptional regulator [Paracoccus homiensis]SET88316.1 DNA-binding transcriptional regulator, GntR family [Paracoccus homiensis]
MNQGLTDHPPAIDPARPVGPQLFARLRTRIVSCDLAPGTRLSEVDIAAHYAISRQPVREAFIKLSEAGLIDIRPQRGSFVSRIDVDAVLAAQFVREAVEADIVRAACRRADDAMLAMLRGNLTAQQRAVDDPAPQTFMDLDEAFHRMIADIAGQSAGWAYLDMLRTQMDRVRHLTASQLPRQILVEQHRQIADAIGAANADEAEQRMRRHLRRVLTDIPLVAAAKPAFFTEAGRR